MTIIHAQIPAPEVIPPTPNTVPMPPTGHPVPPPANVPPEVQDPSEPGADQPVREPDIPDPPTSPPSTPTRQRGRWTVIDAIRYRNQTLYRQAPRIRQ